jgi:homocysteine S-methyltransferase
MVAGDVGPLGVRLRPFGKVQAEEARFAFVEQIEALCQSGIDLLILETFTDLQELLEAVRATRQVCELPVVASMTYTRDDRTLLGDSPAKVATTLAEAGVDVIGVNCSGGPAQIWRILRQMHAAVLQPRFSAMPNAGWPEQVGGRIKYPASADYFGEYALAFYQAGAVLIGGCCGTTPSIAAMRQALERRAEQGIRRRAISLVESEAQDLLC